MTDVLDLLPAMVVPLEGVDPEHAYCWGMEAGIFMRDLRDGEGEGFNLVHAGNLGMIEMIAAHYGWHVNVLGLNGSLMAVDVVRV